MPFLTFVYFFASAENNKDADSLSFLHDISPSPAIMYVPPPAPAAPRSPPPRSPVPADLDYDDRRMSSSATSTADTDSSILSRGEKRSLTPGDSPLPKKQRPDDSAAWEVDASAPPSAPAHDSKNSDAGIDHKVQLPSIFTTFEQFTKV